MSLWSLFKNREHDVEKVSFEDVQESLKISSSYLLLNTLDVHKQDCLIKGTIHASQEELIINEMINNLSCPDKKIIVYGLNTLDDTVYQKVHQLKQLGLIDVQIYVGGLFEWLLLQDIYGENAFPTTHRELDLLKFKPNKKV